MDTKESTAANSPNIRDIDSGDEVSRINSLIKNFIEAEEEVRESIEDSQNWRKQRSTIASSNWTIEMTSGELLRRVDALNESIRQKISLCETGKTKRSSLWVKRAQVSEEKCNAIQATLAAYVENFPKAITEYAMSNLIKNTDDYRNELEAINANNISIKEHANVMKLHERKHSIIDKGLLVKLTREIKSNTNFSCLMKRSGEYELREKKRKVKDYKQAINMKYKRKEKAMNFYSRKRIY